jgi:outer membrane protein assembly factor BamB
MKSNSLLPIGLVGIVLLSMARFTTADDWPQWLGPNRDGVSKETGLLKEWPEGGPKLLWQANDMGDGYSTPSVVADRIYLLGNEGMDNEFLQARSVRDGKRVWSAKIGKVGPNDERMNYPGGRSTPTVVGDVMYVLGSDGDLACVGTDGRIRWQKNLRTEFGGKPGRWAYSESPLVDGDVVVCTPGGAEATLVALNKKDGALIWKSAAGEDAAAYSSPVIAEIGGKKQYVQFLQKGLAGVDAKTGKLLWRWDKPAQGSPANIPTPIVHGDLIYAGSGRAGGGVVRIKQQKDSFQIEELFFEKKVPAGVGGAVRVGDHLYGGAGPSMLSLDFKSGKVLWEERSVTAPAPCVADQRIYLHAEDGAVALIEVNPAAYREKGRFTPPDQPNRGRSKAWAYPVVANGRLFIRDLGKMWCYDVKQKLSAAR